MKTQPQLKFSEQLKYPPKVKQHQISCWQSAVDKSTLNKSTLNKSPPNKLGLYRLGINKLGINKLGFNKLGLSKLAPNKSTFNSIPTGAGQDKTLQKHK